VGCHLSGGLDSSVVTGLASRHRSGLSTYSIRFGHGGWYDETAYAKVMADFAHTEYHEAAPNGRDFAHLLPGLVWHMEMPLPNIGGFSYYTVSKLASKHVKVSLTGHGGDEIFGGYPAQFQTAFGVRPFDGAPDQRLAHPVEPQRGLARLRRFGRRLAKLGVRGVAERITDRLRVRKQTPEELWVALHASQVPQRHPLLDEAFVRSLHGYTPRDAYLAPFRSAPTTELFDKCLYHDLRCYLPALLYMEDRVSMAVSVESRVPLIDHRIVEFMASVPPLQKAPAMQPKGLFRAAATGTIPEMIRRRPDKRPFPVPFQVWVRDVLGELSRDVLLSPQSLDRGIFDPDRLTAWDLTNDEIWCGLNLEIWFRLFIDQDPALIDQANALRSFKALGEYPSPG
jgi:asparagine synthase (glutamine-hydrolysing)